MFNAFSKIGSKNWGSFYKSLSFDKILSFLGSGLENLWKEATGVGMTSAQKESAALSLKNQQALNEEDFQRKLDFYEQYESPAAQVRQYKEAGLNPALMYGNGASVSASGGIGAGSAQAPSPDAPSLVSSFASLLGLSNQRKKIDNDYQLGQMRNSIDAHNIRVQEKWLDVLGRKTSAETIGVQLNNDFLAETFTTRVQGAQNETELKAKQIARLDALIGQIPFQNALLEANTGLSKQQINLVSQQTIGQMWQNAILHAQSKYADEYFKAAAGLQTAFQVAQGMQNTFLSRTLEDRISRCSYELADIIIRAGMDARVYNGEAFAREVAGKMTQKERVQFWTGTGTAVAKTLVTGAVAAYGAGMIGAAGAFPMNGFIPSFTP